LLSTSAHGATTSGLGVAAVTTTAAVDWADPLEELLTCALLRANARITTTGTETAVAIRAARRRTGSISASLRVVG
jgi:hypothetical protein